MGKRRITIKDIAQKLNISASTVSRALHDHSAIKKETKDAVKKLAEELEYYPNQQALSLLQNKTNTIGIIIPEITSHFFSSIITGIQDIIGNTNYNVIICQTDELYSNEVAIAENFLKIGIDGLLVSPSSTTSNVDHFKKIQKRGIPIVIFDRDCPGLEADKVLVDDYDGAFQAVEYLIKSGCKSIAHLGGPINLSISQHRLKGYLDALINNNIPVRNEFIVHAKGFLHEDGILPSKSLLNLKDKPDAIFAVNDCLAIAAMHVAKKMNIEIPNDFSIVGFDDEPHSSYFTPALSTIWQPVYSIGMLSARILLSHLNSPKIKPEFRKEIFKPELIIRASSRKT